MALGKNLQRIREDKGLSQDALAKLTGWTEENPNIGVSQGAISAIEKRDSSSSKHTPALAKALDVPIEKLLGLTAKHEAREPGVIYNVTDPILNDLAELDPEDADVWRAQIRAAAVKARKHRMEKEDRSTQTGPGDPQQVVARTA